MKFAELDFSREYSFADYLKWAFEERLEIIKGKLFKMSPAPTSAHQRLSVEISRGLSNFLMGKSCRVYTAPFDVRLPRKSKRDVDINTVVQPDLCVICDPGKVDKKGCLGAPDIAIEILSPGNNKRELSDKYEVYEESGVREYWLFSYAEKFCIQYTHNFEGHYFAMRPLTVADVLYTPVLPGLELNLGEVFRQV
jgi:Uma2 family endonuclease